MNAEIRIRWLQIIVRNDYYPDLHKVRRFLENQVLTAGLKTLAPFFVAGWGREAP